MITVCFTLPKPAKALISQGLQANDMNAYAGLDPAGDFSDLQSMNADGKCCTMNLRYTEVVSGEPYIRLGYAEQCLFSPKVYCGVDKRRCQYILQQRH